MNDCKYRHGDWCHNPTLCNLDNQDYCPFIQEDTKYCDYYEKG